MHLGFEPLCNQVTFSDSNVTTHDNSKNAIQLETSRHMLSTKVVETCINSLTPIT